MVSQSSFLWEADFTECGDINIQPSKFVCN